MKRLARLAPTAFAAFVFTSFGAVAAPPPDIKLLPDTSKLRTSRLPGFAIAMQKCAICHSADYVAYQPPGMNQLQWTAEMAKMQHSYGAPISDTEVRQIGAYLAVAYGSAKEEDPAIVAASAAAPAAPAVPAAAPAASAGKVDVQALLTQNACLGCHGLVKKIVGPGYHDVAEKYKSDPQAQSRLEASIRKGGSGKWGPVVMPPYAALSPDELKALAAFVLKQ